MNRNPFLTRVKPSYLFTEVAKIVKEYRQSKPGQTLISLAIGDTTIPLPKNVAQAMEQKARDLASDEGYEGYGLDQGFLSLRQQIAATFYKGIDPEDIFISDGAKCDIGRLHLLLGPHRKIGIPDPAYPAYLDTTLAAGSEPIFLPLLPENNFFPSLALMSQCDALFFSSPNNPTGQVVTREQLERLVTFCKKQQILLLFDAAYNLFIEGNLPRSIYEIPGATDVAIEIGSFSKLVGFTGVRLGWTVVPSTLKYRSGDKIGSDWSRIMTTFFNGASNMAQAGGLASLSPEGIEAMEARIAHYKENALLLKGALEEKGYAVYGGNSAPFLWVRARDNKATSWELFYHFLEKYQLITVPGSGFGPSGEGFLRVSALAKRADILEAKKRLTCEKNNRCFSS